MTHSRMREALRTTLLAALLALLVASCLMLLMQASPWHVWHALFTRTLFDSHNLGQVVFRATSLTLAGLAVALALDAGLFNLGVEGQTLAGVWATGVVGAALPATTPTLLAVPLAMLAGVVAGATLGALIGLLRVSRGAHEVIASIMLNAIVGGSLLYFGNRWIFVAGATRGAEVVPSARLPHLGLSGSAANGAVLIALLAVIALAIWRQLRVRGQAVRLVGAAPEVAAFVGVRVTRVRMGAMVASGALAGLVASNLVLGHSHAVEEGLGRGVGYLGVAVALVGRQHPVGILASSLVISALAYGGMVVQDLVAKELMEAVVGVMILAMAIAAGLAQRKGAA